MSHDLIRAVLNRAPDSYSYGLAANALSRRFILTSDDAEVINNAMHYLFPSIVDVTTVPWIITYDKVSEAEYKSVCPVGGQFTIAEVKPGFKYRHYSVGTIEIYISDEGFAGNEHTLIQEKERLSILVSVTTEVTVRLPIRVIREIGLRLSQNVGGCFVHAGAVVVGETSFMIMGPSGAGKTTTLVNFLRLKGAKYVANDRGVVSVASTGLCFKSWPLGVRIGAGTAQSSPELNADGAVFRRSESRLAHDVLAGRLSQTWGSKLKYEYTPLELCHRFNATASMECPIDVVLLPQLKLDNERLSVSKVDDKRKLRDIFLSEITEPIDSEYGTGWLGLRNISEELGNAFKENLIDRLFQLPAIQLSGSPNDFDMRRVIQSISAQLDGVVADRLRHLM